MSLELISRLPDGAPKPTPLLFVHGAWHAAWCWETNFLPYFASKGYRSYALSLRGHGSSPNDKALRWMRVRDYVADVNEVANQLGTPPVIIGHSMGGYVVQKYLEKHHVPGAVLLASIPSSGALAAVMREFIRHPLVILKTVLTLSMYPVVSTPELAKQALFSPDIPDEQFREYFPRLQDESFTVIQEAAIFNPPRPKRVHSPVLVIGAANDAIFTVREIEITGRSYQAQAIIVPDTAHDVMLERNWQIAADHILDWLSSRGL